MSVDLGEYVGAGSADATFVEECVAAATALVEAHIGAADVPAEIKSRAILECGSELFHRRQAPNGIAQFSGMDGGPIRVARDPMLGAYPILAPYVGLGFG